MAGIALEGVSKTYSGGVTAVGGLSLKVEDEELLVIVGPSGCGKTTTLRLIAGLETVSSGSIRIGDRDVTQVAARQRNVALMSQNPMLYPHLTVFSNLTFGWKIRSGGLLKRIVNRRAVAESRREIETRVQQAARVLGIEHLLARRVWQLSGGERQRVALGKILVRQSDACLLDEPLSSLDPRLRNELRREIRVIQRRSRAAMIYVTHDQTEALALGDRIAVLDGGKLQQVGKPKEIYDEPQNRFVAGFFGEPAMNFLAGYLVREDSKVWFRNERVKINVTELIGTESSRIGTNKTLQNGLDGEVELGVRPEDILVHDGSPSQAENTNRIAAVVCDVEYGGGTTLGWVRLDGEHEPESPMNREGKIVVKAGSGTNIRPGDVVSVTLVASRIHLFDRHSGKNLKLVEKA